MDTAAVTGFVSALSLGYLVTTLLPSGVAHLARPRAFRDVILVHGIVPARGAAVVALLVSLAELVIGVAALVSLAGTDAVPTHGVFGVAAVLGLGFALYVHRLLRRPDTGVGCGCGPLASPLTPAALLPGAALVVVSATALVGTAVPAGGPVDAFGALWGVTLAVVVMLVPASMPPVHLERSA